MTRKRLKKLLMGKGFKRNLAEWVSRAGPRAAPSIEAYWKSVEPMFSEEFWKGVETA